MNEVKHSPSESQFIIESENFASILKYSIDNQTMTIFSTSVPPEGRGQGLAGKLAKTALDYAQENNLKVIPSCSYIDTYIKRHDNYQKLL